MVRQVGSGTRIVGLLRFPGDDAALDVNIPGARSGTIDAMCRAHDLVVLPTLAVAILPAPVLAGRDAMPIGETLGAAIEERQTVKKMAHCLSSFIRRVAGLRVATNGYVRCRAAGRRDACRR